MDGSADALIARVQQRPRQSPKANRPHAIHRPWSVPETSDFYNHQTRCACDEDDNGPTAIDEFRAINDAPSKSAPATQVPFTNERPNGESERATDEYDGRRRSRNTATTQSRPPATLISTHDDRLRYEQVTTSTILTQLRTTDLQCSYMLYIFLHGQQSYHIALGHRGKGGSLWQWAVGCAMFSFLSCRQSTLPSLMRAM
ncbi:hypothetical protein FDENT_8605 [Fusarium denticulatum]|uniref:Uncharacterized protein n=1 Tax=Fusarium denticulatum TaxID=48507 RepID=A0A8H5X1I9_9HYPO|nr:hypothetical protein FDENT_8605 [Fusarium denticulatum]